MPINPTAHRREKKRKASDAAMYHDDALAGIENGMAATFSYNFKIKKPFHFNENHKLGCFPIWFVTNFDLSNDTWISTVHSFGMYRFVHLYDIQIC